MSIRGTQTRADSWKSISVVVEILDPSGGEFQPPWWKDVKRIWKEVFNWISPSPYLPTCSHTLISDAAASKFTLALLGVPPHPWQLQTMEACRWSYRRSVSESLDPHSPSGNRKPCPTCTLHVCQCWWTSSHSLPASSLWISTHYWAYVHDSHPTCSPTCAAFDLHKVTLVLVIISWRNLQHTGSLMETFDVKCVLHLLTQTSQRFYEGSPTNEVIVRPVHATFYHVLPWWQCQNGMSLACQDTDEHPCVGCFDGMQAQAVEALPDMLEWWWLEGFCQSCSVSEGLEGAEPWSIREWNTLPQKCYPSGPELCPWSAPSLDHLKGHEFHHGLSEVVRNGV